MLFGFMGLGIDASLVYVNKGKVQDIADAAALAGAAHLGEEGDVARSAVEEYGKANGLQVTSNEMVSVTSDGWDSLEKLGDNENLSGASPEDEPDKWLDGSIYAGNMLRVSYKTKNPADGKNMFSINGYIFADMLHTGLPLQFGTSNDRRNPSDDRVIRGEYVRKKDGDNVLTGFAALTPSNYVVPGWNCTAQQKAEEEIAKYSAELRGMIANETLNQNAMNKVGNNRYICNQAVKDDLDAKGIVVKDLLFERVNKDNGKEDTGWKNKSSKDTNHQYSNIEVGCEEIDVLYVEMQGDWKGQDLELSREGAVWLGAYPKTDQLKKARLLIVELKTEPTTEQKTRNLTAKDLTGSFIITPGSSGCEFGAIYSQANLEIRAPYSQKDDGNHNTFNGPIFSEKFVSFSYDDQCGGGGRAHPSFGKDVVIAANVVLFGYGYEIGPSVHTNNTHMGTHYYDDLTSYKTDNSTTDLQNNWWENGIKTVDEWYDGDAKQIYHMDNFDLHDAEYLKENPDAINEVELLQKLWQAIDCREHVY